MNDMDPKLSYSLQYNRHGVRMAMPPAFVTPGIANSAGVKNRVGNAAQQATQNPISPSGNVQSSNSVGYDIGTGWWIGFDKGVPKLFIGNSLANKLTWDGQTLTVSGNFVIGGTIITVDNAADVQPAMIEASAAGGGRVILAPGMYDFSASSITGASNVSLEGSGIGQTIVDFGGSAHGVVGAGTNGYTTGTVAVSAGATSVVGSGTTWTVGMIGRSILLKDFWYEITAVADTTHLTIGSAYSEAAISGSAYAIADTIDDFSVKNLTLQNSSGALLTLTYFDVAAVDTVLLADGGSALVHSYGSSPSLLTVTTDNCGSGFVSTLSQIGTLFNCYLSNITAGPAISANGMNNWTLLSFIINGVTGNGMTLQNVSNTGISIFSVDQCTGKGIEFVSNNGSAIAMENGFVNGCGSDGIKLTATTDITQMTVCTITNNGGYGVNIAAASCDNNLFLGNYFATNSSGNFNNSGTGTLIRSNIGVADN